MAQAHPLRGLTAALLVAAAAGCAAPGPVHYSSRSDEREFYEGFARDGKTFPSAMDEIHGGIVSHHLFAGGHISAFFATIRKAPAGEAPRTFIILGPDHRRQCAAITAATRRPWKTPFGTCPPDLALADRLCAAGAAAIDEDAFIGEHSVGAVIPFIAHYFPRSKVAPLLLSYRMSWEEARRLGLALAAEAGAGAILILSSDFVHDRSSAEARRLDKRTREILVKFRDEVSAETVRYAEMDCRKGLMALMAYVKARKSGSMEILHNTDSARMAGRNVPTTSYFFVLYGNKKVNTQAP
ncbi:MAG: AmmeMemoRadiSam system protein B [Spirochaetes bacterium]|nr:AmmeMemoRadiSam system protein B [Spirochaetota bacterium]